MQATKLPSLRVCAFVSKFFDEWTAEERNDFFALVTAPSKLTLTIDEIEKAIASAGDIGRAAASLGYSRRTLQLHMRKLGMPASRGGRPKGPSRRTRVVSSS